MGDPEPLELELLKRGDNDEICRAIRELELLSLAQQVVSRVIGNRYPTDVRAVALESIEKLFTSVIDRCRSIDDIRPNLATVANWRAINFLNVAFRKWEIQVGDELLPGLQERAAAPEVNSFEDYGEILAEGLGMEEFQLASFKARLLEAAGLDEHEKRLLIEHIFDGGTQPEFSNRYGIALHRIGRIKDRLIEKISRWLMGEFIGEIRAEFSQRLRRNEIVRKIRRKR